ncbi:S1 family peptidase [Parasphingorhabdus pacifica]
MSLARTLSGAVGVALAAATFAAPAQAAPTQEAPAQTPPAQGAAVQAAQPTDWQPYIIDGEVAENAPWAARLFNQGQEACTASVIAPEWVLTAEHCVAGSGGDISFNVGSLNQHEGETFNAKPGGVHVHDTADLALVNVEGTMNVEAAPLGEAGDVAVGDTVRTYGWGATCTDQPEIDCQSDVLKVAEVDVTAIDCADYRGGTAVCADRNNGIPAGGDSGGPMFAGDVQVGVASTSDRVSRTAYTNITEYRDWISSLAGV